jgi:V-type H+-transporting ATPase subunit H
VADYDLSQFLQYHPSGRIVVADLKAKDRVMKMKLTNHENAADVILLFFDLQNRCTIK